MARYGLGPKSILRLRGVHQDLVAVVRGAILVTSVDFTVLEGLRTAERQRQLLLAGATRTMKSRHLTGHAVDLGAWVGGSVRWDWPLYDGIAEAMKSSARQLGVPLEWGGDWTSFKDGPHFQLPWSEYPAGS